MNRTLFAMLLAFSIAISFSSHAAEKAPVKRTSASDEVYLAPNSPQFANLKVEPVIEITAPATEALNGKITFDENYTARISSPVLGRAVSIRAQIGDTVKAGQVLMIMDSPELGSALADARKADADLQLKRKAFERTNLLLGGGVIARKDQESSQADLSQAEAEAQRADARLKSLGAQRSGNQSYILRAPITGVVVDRQVNPSSEVRPDATTPLFTITNPDHLWASIDLPELDLGKIFKGQHLSIQVDAYPDEVFSGTVESIGVMVDPTTRRVTVRCSLQSKGKLKPEMYARITPLNSKNIKVIRLPNTALITEGLYNYVFAEVSPGHFKKRRISLSSQERDFVTVKNGLSVGEQVITTGAILMNSELAVSK
ncbi:cobalt-zinc-cadmium resistance protein CzcB [mine drainage metagenome]|uniref:Cobalt-zinc-cadmium resistance protein CzcB n=1 Tax=mine drainage metagenome TaxID=410659 RepID=A0A1J5SUY6_9ZZZZ